MQSYLIVFLLMAYDLENDATYVCDTYEPNFWIILLYIKLQAGSI